MTANAINRLTGRARDAVGVRRVRRAVGAVATAAIVLLSSACSGGSRSGQDANTISYWLWDSAQQPGYQACADAFAAENPGLKVEITQMGWDNYWSKLTAGMIADRAPDVFTDHLNYFAQYADLKVLLPLDELEATKDIKSSDYQKGLADLWVGQDGHRYGAPKDWDTVAFFYNTKMVAEAGLSEQQLGSMAWNPDDGGTFEKVVAHLTVDANGKRGDEAGFDKAHVKVYGLASSGSGAPMGQTQWGAFAGSLGNWNYTDKNPWGTTWRFDDPRYQKMLSWYFGLAQKGYMPGYSVSQSLSGYQAVASGVAAMNLDGSWMISSYSGTKGLDWKLAPTPIGPSGKRSSPFNGLADSITKFAKNPQAAAKWVKFLSGETCQNIIGKAGVVFPARPQGTEFSVEARKAAGIDVSAFTDHIADSTTMLIPVTRNAADINAIYKPDFDAVYIGTSPVSVLTADTQQVNKMMELSGP